MNCHDLRKIDTIEKITNKIWHKNSCYIIPQGYPRCHCGLTKLKKSIDEVKEEILKLGNVGDDNYNLNERDIKKFEGEEQ